MLQKIGCIGGGPGGLFFALLAKSADPSRKVTVYERNRASDTFGFGVVFSDATLARIDEADPVLRTALHEHGVHWDPIEVRLKGERLRCGGMGMAAVERKTLLGLLQQRARAAGVDIRFEASADPAELLASDVDLIVAADGANSGARAMFADQFVPSVEVATAKFIWLGTTYPFEGLTFVHQRGPHGVFAVHGYPIGNGVSTFIVETDEASWRNAGLDSFDVNQPPGSSDEESKSYLENLFAEQIDGASLLTNNSRWGNFRTWRTRAWSHGRMALLGDAAHTAHFSVGSGTKMAMEDAVALAAALDRHGADVPALLSAYEQDRQPQVARIQDSARPSLSWWEHFGRYHDSLQPWQFAYHFLTRSITDAQLARRDPGFVGASHDRWVAEHRASPLHTPISIGAAAHGGRIVTVQRSGGNAWAALDGGPLALHTSRPDRVGPWALWMDAPDTEAGLPEALDLLGRAVTDDASLVVVGGGGSLTRRLLTEHARLELGLVSVLMADDFDSGESGVLEDWCQTMVLSGRTDLIGLTDAPTCPRT
ncbi:MAG: FAD-dependent monooxygenase [Actinomycetota bacterium]|nr:FAD-dependent monooxygenase [Actinomycetota bacterium]